MIEQKFSINYQLKNSTNTQMRKQKNTMKKRRNIRSRDQRTATNMIGIIETIGVIIEDRGETTETIGTISSMIDTRRKRNKRKWKKKSFRQKCLQKQIRRKGLHSKIQINRMRSQGGNQQLSIGLLVISPNSQSKKSLADKLIKSTEMVQEIITIGRDKVTLTKKETKSTINNRNMEETEVDIDKSNKIGMVREEKANRVMARIKDKMMITSSKRKRVVIKRITTRNQRTMLGKIMKNQKANSNSTKEARISEEGENNIEVRETIREITLTTVLNVSEIQ